MTHAGSGDFGEFYATHFQRIALQMGAYLGDHAEAQDVTQDAFCRAYDRWGKIASFADPSAWVRRVAWNLATSRLRHLQVVTRHLARQRTEHVEGPGPDRVALIGALAKLPPKQRLAVVLHHIGHLSTAEIAEQEGVAEGTVRSWLSRGRSLLGEYLIEEHASDWEAAAAAAPPPNLDRTVALAGRRRALRRSAFVTALVVVVAIPVAVLLLLRRDVQPPTYPPPSSCAVEETIVGLRSTLAADPTGRYLVTVSTSGDVALWADGAPLDLDPPGEVVQSLAVNRFGMVAGSSSIVVGDRTEYMAWVYRDRAFQVIDRTADKREVRDFNARGEVLFSPREKGRGPDVWRSGAGFRELTADGMDALDAVAIGDDGTIVGNGDLNGGTVPLMWTGTVPATTLPFDDGYNTYATAIRGDWILGGRTRVGASEGGEHEILRWNRRTAETIIVSGLGMAWDITGQGWSVGDLNASPALNLDGLVLRLPVPDVFDRIQAFRISDDGRKVFAWATGREPALLRWSCGP